MGSTIASLTLALSVASTGGLFSKGEGGRIVAPGPGYGWGFPNGNPDGYGWVDYGTALPLSADRTPDYFFPRNFALPAMQSFPTMYYNPYVSNGQRYVSFSGCGGDHPAGRAPIASALTPDHPYQNNINNQPMVTPPSFTGRVEAPPVPAGGSGLIP